MSTTPLPSKRRILAHQVKDSDPARDQIISWGASINKDRLLPLPDWLRAGSPTGEYKGPTPTYKLIFNWKNVEDTGPVEVINKAMERCFGSRGVEVWELWIRGDQLSLLLADFREEYMKMEEAKEPELGILDLWVEDLFKELQRV